MAWEELTGMADRIVMSMIHAVAFSSQAICFKVAGVSRDVRSCVDVLEVINLPVGLGSIFNILVSHDEYVGQELKIWR